MNGSLRPVSPPRFRRLLHSGVMLVVDDAERYVRLVQKARTTDVDVILRVMCCVEPAAGTVSIRHAAPISLLAVESRYAASLSRLLDTTEATQIVLWLTVEPEDARAAVLRGVDTSAVLESDAHTCAVIDAFQDQPVWEGPLHEPPAARHASVNREPVAELSPRPPSIASHDVVVRKETIEKIRRVIDDEPAASPSHRGAARRLSEDEPPPLWTPCQFDSMDHIRQLDELRSSTLLCVRTSAKVMSSVADVHARLDRLSDAMDALSRRPTITPDSIGELSWLVQQMEQRLRTVESNAQYIANAQRNVLMQEGHRPVAVESREASVQTTLRAVRDSGTQSEYFDVIHPEQRSRRRRSSGSFVVGEASAGISPSRRAACHSSNQFEYPLHTLESHCTTKTRSVERSNSSSNDSGFAVLSFCAAGYAHNNPASPPVL